MPPRPLPQVKRIANAAPLHKPMGMQMQPMPRQGQVLKSQSLHSLRPGTQLSLFARPSGAR